MNARARRERALVRDRRRGFDPTFHEAPIIGPLTGFDLWMAGQAYSIINGEPPTLEPGPPRAIRLEAVGEPFRGQLARALGDPFRMLGSTAPCREMETRTCPPAGRCGWVCARFESDEPTPWL